MSSGSVSRSGSWRKIEPLLAKGGDPPRIFGLSSDDKVKGRAKSQVSGAIRRRLNGEGEDVRIGDLPYTVDEVMAYVANLFRPGMTWKNWGEWHIDHIKSRAEFDLRDPKQFFACWSLSNLQPLWATENIAKSAIERRRSRERVRAIS